MALQELIIPDIGTDDKVNVAEVYIKVGDTIQVDDNLIMLETDKASMEVPAEFAGVIKEINIKKGDKVGQGDLIAKTESVTPTSNTTAATATANTPSNCDVLVIGAGPGGYTAAFRAADLGLSVILVEKYPTLGGVCLNVGCIPSKALLHVAKVINEADEMSHHGIDFGKPKLDIDKIRDFKKSVVSKLTTGLSGLAKQRKVKIIQGIAKFNSSNSVVIQTNDNKTQNLTFKQAIIAAGSRSFKVPGFPNDDPRILDSTSALDLKDIPKQMLVVGGGIIGLEMAEVYSTLGAQITIVEMADGLIMGADRDLVKVLEARISKRYSEIHTKTKCAKIDAKVDGLYVTFEKDGKSLEPQRFDKILVAAGRIPNGKNLDAQLAGVNVDERGFIAVNKQGQTNIPHIYAIGDIVGNPMLAHKATHEGRIAAENCAGLKAFFDARTIPSIAYTDPEIAWMGLTETEAKAQGIEIEVGKFPWAASGRALGNGRSDGFTKVITQKGSHKILGAGIVGVNAGELLAETVLALEMDCNIHDVALSIHAHPTLSESVAFACEMVDGSITDLYVPKKPASH